MSTCETCRHWREYDYRTVSNPPLPGRGECETQDQRMPFTGYDAANNKFIITRADFGCILHEAKATDE